MKNTTASAALIAHEHLNDALRVLTELGIDDGDFDFGEGVYLSDLIKQAEKSIAQVACELKRLHSRAEEALWSRNGWTL